MCVIVCYKHRAECDRRDNRRSFAALSDRYPLGESRPITANGDRRDFWTGSIVRSNRRCFAALNMTACFWW